MKKTVVILSGARLSAESGIATFRDSDGLWSNYKNEYVCTPEAYHIRKKATESIPFAFEKLKKLCE